MHFFVTGATGFIGSNFINKALAKDYQVTALSKQKSSPKISLCKEPVWCRGDLEDDWSSQLSECDVFVHFAAEGVVNNSENWNKCLEVNYIKSDTIIRNAYDSGIRKFLICGSCFEYGFSGDEYKEIPVNAKLKPIGPYSYSKALAGLSALNFAKNNNLSLILARLFHVYGLGENPHRFWPSLVDAALKGSNFKMTYGKQLRNFSTVEETVSKLISFCLDLESLERGGLVRNVGSKNNMSLREFAEREWARLGAKGSIKYGSYPYKEKEVMSYIPELDY